MFLYRKSDVKNETFSNCYGSSIYGGPLLLRDRNFVLLEATYIHTVKIEVYPPCF